MNSNPKPKIISLLLDIRGIPLNGALLGWVGRLAGVAGGDVIFYGEFLLDVIVLMVSRGPFDPF